MAVELDAIRAELLSLAETTVAEKAQVDAKFADLEARLEEALTKPSEPLDVSDILDTIRGIRGQVAAITEPALLEVPPADEPDEPLEPGFEIIDGEPEAGIE